ncbi:hypothetical protein L1987_50675 [Smallanthus sonchifolius]|uniref:Uncharacterized protein n=1 Tax=Smallanthus sonchifolius TaxID=185202 RepID=A0ACB9EN41_9ASTR|nr:hypothetical protein L1987_50675 [Smallanthus sonchifolius]
MVDVIVYLCNEENMSNPLDAGLGSWEAKTYYKAFQIRLQKDYEFCNGIRVERLLKMQGKKAYDLIQIAWSYSYIQRGTVLSQSPPSADFISLNHRHIDVFNSTSYETRELRDCYSRSKDF